MHVFAIDLITFKALHRYYDLNGLKSPTECYLYYLLAFTCGFARVTHWDVTNILVGINKNYIPSSGYKLATWVLDYYLNHVLLTY